MPRPAGGDRRIQTISLLAPGKINDLLDNKIIDINFEIYKGRINKSNKKITLRDLHPQFEKNRFYLEKQYKALSNLNI
jgi:hypothetical protein